MDTEQILRGMQEEMEELKRQLGEKEQPPPFPPEQPPIKNKFQHVAIPYTIPGPEVSASNFELKLALIRLVHQNTFGGRPTVGGPKCTFNSLCATL